MVVVYKKWKKYNEIQLTKNKMDLNIRKITNNPPSPVEEGKKRGTSIKRSKAGTKERSPDGLSLLNQNRF